MPVLEPRYTRCYDRNGYQVRCPRSVWNDWVRWVVLAVIIIGFFLLFVLCSCITARRRRKAGRNPFYGTGWAAAPPKYGENQNTQPYYNNQTAAPPYSPPNQAYSPQPTYGGQPQYGPAYGQQQQGVELQSPQPAYSRPGDNVYAPPPGPPPGKGDGVIR